MRRRVLYLVTYRGRPNAISCNFDEKCFQEWLGRLPLRIFNHPRCFGGNIDPQRSVTNWSERPQCFRPVIGQSGMACYPLTPLPYQLGLSSGSSLVLAGHVNVPHNCSWLTECRSDFPPGGARVNSCEWILFTSPPGPNPALPVSLNER